MKNSSLKHKMNRLGDDLNVDQAWAEYELVNRKKKKHLWIYVLPFILIAVGISYNLNGLKENQKSNYSSIATDHNDLTQGEVELERSNASASTADVSLISTNNDKYLVSELDVDLIIEQSNTQSELSGIDNRRHTTDNLSFLNIKKPSTSRHSPSEQDGVLYNGNRAWEFQKIEPDTEKGMSNEPVTTYGDVKARSATTEIIHIDYLKPMNMGLLTTAQHDIHAAPGISMTNQIENIGVHPKWNIGIAYEYAAFERKLTGPDANHIQRRNLTEQLLESSRINFAISKFLSSRFYISSGLSINQYRTKIDNRYTTFTSIIVEDAVVEVIKTNNVVKEVKGRTNAILIKNSRDILYQRYLDLSIPINLGYRLSLNNRLRLDVSLGLAWSPFIQVKGKLHESYFSIDDYREISELEYRSSDHFQGLANIRFIASINRSFDVHIGGQYRRDISNRILSENGAVDRFNSGGVSIGINMNIY